VIEEVDDIIETIVGRPHLNGASLLNGRLTPRAIHEKNLRTGPGRSSSVLGVGTGEGEDFRGVLSGETVNGEGELLIVDSDVVGSSAASIDKDKSR
jgi:hypothetical protein